MRGNTFQGKEPICFGEKVHYKPSFLQEYK